MVSKEPMDYNINVIPDLYPVIQTEQQQDSLSTQLLYFKGLIRDDYGFSKMAFHYRFIKTSEENLRTKIWFQKSFPLIGHPIRISFFMPGICGL
ncbi:MAG: hypothetical protein IPL74_12290 [Bacteroidetes bacterium]|nr:hypothetical protein [Bacteroidota bacterium]